MEILRSATYLARLDHPTPMTAKVMSEIFKDMTRTACRRVYRTGSMRGAWIVALRFSQKTDQSRLAARLDGLTRDKGVAGGEIWMAASAAAFPISEEERLRGGDRKIEACLLVETLRQAGAEAIAAVLSRDFPEGEIGVYRLLCEIESADCAAAAQPD